MNGRKVLASLLIVFGGIMLADNILPQGMISLFWPALLIVIGLMLILKPDILAPKGVKYRPIASISNDGDWNVQDEEYRMFVGDVDLDYTQTTLPDGVTHLRISAFVPDVDLRVPTDVGLRIISNAFVTDAKVNGESKSYVMTTMRFSSDNFAEADKKLDVEINCFVSDLNIRYK